MIGALRLLTIFIFGLFAGLVFPPSSLTWPQLAFFLAFCITPGAVLIFGLFVWLEESQK